MATLTASGSIRPLAERTKLFDRERSPRFTRDGSDELELNLTCTCEQVRDWIQRIIPRDKLEALILGGGYGRGEGGVLKTGSGDQPYNDLEFYVCVRGNRFLNDWRYTRDLHALGGKLARAAGVEIEFKIISLAHLRRSPVTMFYYDLVTGHRWLLGNEELLHGCEHHLDAGNLPLLEATRLLMNRCSGLLFAQEKLERKPFADEDADFVGRNLAKARLAFGDAVLASFGQYHWSCLERHERLRHLNGRLPWLAEISSLHAAGVSFKLHPQQARAPITALGSEFEEIRALGLSVWLWLENQRLGSSFQSARDYAMSSVNKCPDTNPWRNYLVNVKAFGPLRSCAQRPMRCPKETLFNAMTLLLWEPWRSDPQLMRHLRHELRMCNEARDIPRAYHSLWAQFN